MKRSLRIVFAYWLAALASLGALACEAPDELAALGFPLQREAETADVIVPLAHGDQPAAGTLVGGEVALSRSRSGRTESRSATGGSPATSGR